MKFPPLSSLLVIALGSIAFAEDTSAPPAAKAPAGPVPSAIQMRVQQSNKMVAPEKSLTRTQSRFLKLFLSNSSHEDASLKIKYAFFGHTINEHSDFVVLEGDKDATVKPAVISEEDTPTATVTETKAVKNKPASGEVLVGYGVQVFQGDKLVAEAYEPSYMKDLMGKAPAAPKAAAAPGKPAVKAKATPKPKATPAAN